MLTVPADCTPQWFFFRGNKKDWWIPYKESKDEGDRCSDCPDTCNENGLCGNYPDHSILGVDAEQGDLGSGEESGAFIMN